MYEASDDSELLRRHVAAYAKGNVLDMCTGSGVIAEEAAQHARVVAVDSDPKALAHAKQHCSSAITFIESDLFAHVEGMFDVIFCNPPYLPEDEGIEDVALYGGKEGYEFIERFVMEAKKYLAPDGVILLIFSSFSKPEHLKTIFTREGYAYSCLEKIHISFEDLYCYELRPL